MTLDLPQASGCDIVESVSPSPTDALPDTLEHEALKQPLAPRQTLATLVVVQGSEADLGAHARVEGRVRIGRDHRPS